MRDHRKMVVISAAGLGAGFAGRQNLDVLSGVRLQEMDGTFPAVTCTAQADFRTGTRADKHGMVANGLYDRRFQQVRFWEQASSLVEGERIWADFRSSGGRVGVFFWQQALGEDVDFLLSPAPIHTHSGRMVMDCASRPDSLYEELRSELGGFPLHRYWGPLASATVGNWISKAVVKILQRSDAPELLMVYLPTLDYDLQRYGPESDKALRACRLFERQAGMIFEQAEKQGYSRLIFGDYAIVPVTGGAVYLNALLLDAGYLSTRSIRGRLYPDFCSSRAFAVVDHEVAHIYIRAPEDIEAVRSALTGEPGVDQLFDADDMARLSVGHIASGELLAVAKDGYWFAYPWWRKGREAPDYATHIDIHRKPGYDPCEMFFSLFPPGVSQDTGRIHGSHGRAGRTVAWGSDAALPGNPKNISELGSSLGRWLVD